jgi:molybdenum cofactor cytidylyltransferase
MSTRFGPGNKLLARIGGRALVERVATTYIAAGLDPVIVVVGFEASLVSAELACSPVVIVPNPNFGAGQSRALVRGVRNLPASAPAAVIGVADQPFLTPRVIEALIEAYRARAPRIVAPLFSGRRGNPVLFDRSLFGELLAVTGDQGGRPEIERHLGEVEWVEVGDEKAALDVDSEEDLRSLEP